MRNKESNSGITLIALVVTIIVLLILAGISLAMLTGPNGLINKATQAGSESIIGEEKERVAIAYNGALTEKYKTDINATVNAEDMQKEFDRNGTNIKEVTQEGNRIRVVFAKTGNVYYIEKDGTITSAGSIDVGNSTNVLEIEVREEETESRAVALVVIPKINGLTYEQYLQTKSDEELIQIFVDGMVRYDPECYEGIENVTLENVLYAWDCNTLDEFFEEYECDDLIKTIVKLGYADESIDTSEVFTIICNGETQEAKYVGEYAEFAIAENGEYNIFVTSTKGGTVTTIANITKCKIEEYSEIYEANTELMIDGYTVTIPAGFAVGISSNINSVNKGLVITDAIKKVNGKNYSVGNEFVWIPVNKNNLKVENTGKPMAKLNKTYIEGVLYWFYDEGEAAYSKEMTYYGQGTNTHREPAYLTDSEYGDASPNNTIGITQTSLQSEYDEMIESIQEYGGFYVGRYEMGIENGKAVSKLGVKPTSSEDSETEMWYGLYQKAKTYTNTKKTSNSSVVSNMIWGSQYDAILNFVIANNNSDKSKINSIEYGNYNGKLLNTGRLLKTGLTRTSDSINNIYDLGGNLFEWTLEAAYTDSRVERGGGYDDDGATPASNRNEISLEYTYSSVGCRTTLYIGEMKRYYIDYLGNDEIVLIDKETNNPTTFEECYARSVDLEEEEAFGEYISVTKSSSIEGYDYVDSIEVSRLSWFVQIKIKKDGITYSKIWRVPYEPI